MFARLFWAIATCSAVLVAALRQPLPSVVQGQPLIERVRRAVQVSAPRWAATQVSGKAAKEGNDYAYSFSFLPDGRFMESLANPTEETNGNDGKRYWRENDSGDVEELDLEDRDRQMAINLLLSDNWLFLTAPIQLSEDKDIVHLTFNETGVRVDIRIDPSSSLPTEAVFQTPTRTTIKLGDWREAGDRKIPMRVEVMSDGDTESYVGGELKAIRPSDVQSAMPQRNVSNFAFDAAKSPVIEAAFAGKSHIRIHPLINGQDVGWFILDSGSGAMVIDKAVADSLHLDDVSHGSATGVGGNFESHGRTADRFELGPLTMRHMKFGDFDLTPINKGSKLKMAGIIGTPLFRRAIVELDWKGPTIKIYDRAKYVLERGAWQRLRFSDDNPAVLAQLEGTPKSWYRLDSGGAGFLTMHTPFVEKWKLLDGRETKESSASGLGGTVASRTGTAKWFEIGSHRFQNPTVEFSTTHTGSFTDPYLAGNIGIDALKQFKVVFDFTGNRVAFLQ